MITLIQFPKSSNRPSLSPFCLKLETYLKLVNLPYETKFTVSMKGSQKKKMPMILDDGVLIEDSTAIIAHLKDKHGVDLDRHLTSEQKAITRAFQWLCEKSIVDWVMYFRWVDQENWPRFRDLVFSGAPWLVKATIGNSMAKGVKKMLYRHGMGRFDESEIMKIAHSDLRALSDYLGEKTYFFGNQVSTVDVIVFACLAQIPADGPVRQFHGLRKAYPNLEAFTTRFAKTHWPELKV